MLAVVHATHVHTTHLVLAMVHATHVHAHVRMRQVGHGIHGGYLRRHGRIRREGSPGIAGAINGLGKDGVGAIVRLHNDIVGFSHPDAEFIHGHRLHVLAVRRHHRHLQTRNAHIEETHGRTVDETQAHLLTLTEQSRPTIGRGLAVHEIGIGVTGNVCQIPLAHSHAHPHLALGPGTGQALFLEILHQLAVGPLVEVVVMAEFLQLGIDHRGVLVRPVGQHDHIVAVIGEGFGFLRIDDDGAIQAGLFLEPRVAVIPVGTALHHLELVAMGSAGGNAGEAIGDIGHPVLAAGQYDAVPVNGAGFRQVVLHPQGDRVALLPAQDGRGKRAVHGSADARRTREVHHLFTNGQVEITAPQGGNLLLLVSTGPQGTGTQPQAGGHASHGQSLHKAAA